MFFFTVYKIVLFSIRKVAINLGSDNISQVKRGLMITKERY